MKIIGGSSILTYLFCFCVWQGEGVVFEEDRWYQLFNGKDLSGWVISENPTSFWVEKGSIVAQGPRAHLFYVGEDGQAFFKDFELYLEVKIAEGANSGIYFHTAYQPSGWPSRGFEIQLNNSQPEHEGYYEYKKTGSLYGIRNIYKTVVPDNVWFPVRIRVQANHIQVWIDECKVVDFIASDERDYHVIKRLTGGTVALQCHDPQSRVEFRNIWIKSLSTRHSSIKSPITELSPKAYQELLRLYRENYPIIDLHAHPKGGLTVDQIIERFYSTGINYGIAVNAGIGFSITNQYQLSQWLEEHEGLPLFLGLQVEGREWPTLFPLEVIAKFDYVFTDAMTFVDSDGRRVRLWIDDEVKIEDPQRFMDEYVDLIVNIIKNEPIDIYANPTFLPSVIAHKYDELWTQERMLRVIKAAVEEGVAIEINDKYRLPSPTFIRLAKANGVKFTLGTNNSGAQDLAFLDYGLKMIKECGLVPSDFWVPGKETSRAKRLLLKERAINFKDKMFVYVGTYTGKGSQGIYGWRFVDNIHMQKLGCVAGIPNPSFIISSKDGRRLYAVSELSSPKGQREAGRLHAFLINQFTGQLEHIGEISTGGDGPCHLMLTPDESAIIVANYESGSIGVVSLDKDGRPKTVTQRISYTGKGIHPQRQQSPHPHCVTLSPDKRLVFIADLGTDRVYVYRINKKGGLTELISEPELDIKLGEGRGPRHLVFHPDGRTLYIINELANTVTVYSYEISSGKTTFLQEISVLPVGFDHPNTAAEIAVDFSGRWLLVSNRGADLISVFRILPTGMLSGWRFVPTGGQKPRHFTFSPDGKEVWVGNQDSDRVTIFSFDPNSGGLFLSGRYIEVSQPACVLFIAK